MRFLLFPHQRLLIQSYARPDTEFICRLSYTINWSWSPIPVKFQKFLDANFQQCISLINIQMALISYWWHKIKQPHWILIANCSRIWAVLLLFQLLHALQPLWPQKQRLAFIANSFTSRERPSLRYLIRNPFWDISSDFTESLNCILKKMLLSIVYLPFCVIFQL